MRTAALLGTKKGECSCIDCGTNIEKIKKAFKELIVLGGKGFELIELISSSGTVKRKRFNPNLAPEIKKAPEVKKIPEIKKAK